jgi:hypothetical protein
MGPLQRGGTINVMSCTSKQAFYHRLIKKFIRFGIWLKSLFRIRLKRLIISKVHWYLEPVSEKDHRYRVSKKLNVGSEHGL